MAPAQALRSMFPKAAEPRTGTNSDRASSGESSWTPSDRPIARPMACTCSACVSDCGPVTTYSAPAWPSSHNVRTATAATSRSSVGAVGASRYRSEEHTSELQSQSNLVCRLLLEKKKKKKKTNNNKKQTQ